MAGATECEVDDAPQRSGSFKAALPCVAGGGKTRRGDSVEAGMSESPKLEFLSFDAGAVCDPETGVCAVPESEPAADSAAATTAGRATADAAQVGHSI